MDAENVKINKQNVSKKCNKKMILITGVYGVLATVLAVAGIKGCSDKDLPTVAKEVRMGTYDLDGDDSYRIISSVSKSGDESINFVKKISLSNALDTTKNYADIDKYQEYKLEQFSLNDTYLYMDVDKGDVITVEYDRHVKDENGNDSIQANYTGNMIYSDSKAFDVVSMYTESKDSYTLGEIKSVINSFQNEEENQKVMKK